MIEPLIKTIEVPCDQAMAFRVFVEEMHTWWPLSKYTVSAMGGAPARTLLVDAKVGGEIVEISADGTRHLWGAIKSYDPYGYFSMDFHIPIPGEVVESRSLVEVTFTVLGEERTRVELNQSNWEAFGDMAAALRGGYGGGWVEIFEQAYKAACGRDVTDF